jgi:hypothetical protein
MYAIVMRKVQGLRCASDPRTRTIADVVVGLAAELHRHLDDMTRWEIPVAHVSEFRRFNDLMVAAGHAVMDLMTLNETDATLPVLVGSQC